VYLHYVLDQWTDQWRQAARGAITIVRYADDAILGFEHQNEAERYLRELKERLREFGLELNEDKTRLIRFGRFAAFNRAERGEGKPEAFTFLGLQHICGENRLGRFEVRRITDGKRRRKKLQELKQELRRRMHAPFAQVGEWLRSVLRGYYQYHAVPGNLAVLSRFRRQVARLWFRTLSQRSQRRPTWTKLSPIFDHWATHSSCGACVSRCSFRRQTSSGVTSKVRTVCSSSCKYGSVRGVVGNGHPYRDGVLGLLPRAASLTFAKH
jgi:RNA-directed DNA polymerase